VQIEEKKEEKTTDQVVVEEKIEEPKEEPKEEIKIQIFEEIIEEKIDEGKSQPFLVIFPADRADFTGLSHETVESNYTAIRHAAEFLSKNRKYRVILEGHANPTTPEGGARENERFSLIHLSEQRAFMVLEELGKLGVSYSRMTVLGAGFSKTTVPYNDNENNWKNRKVEFIFITEEGEIK